jgi:hypothetical protein
MDNQHCFLRNPEPMPRHFSVKRFFLPSLLVGFLFLAGHGWAQTNDVAGRTNGVPRFHPFKQVLTNYFAQWDADGNGVLSSNEIDVAVGSSKFQGEPAAAISAIKLVVRGGKYNLPPLTLDYLLQSPLREARVTNDASFVENTAVDAKPSDAPPSFSLRYINGLNRLRRTQRELFPDNLPAIQNCQQGRLGDCYLISVIGGMAFRNPGDIKAMFRTNADGSAVVTFRDGQSAIVPPLTDGEILLSSSAGSNGLWLAVLENAYGRLRLQSQHADSEDTPLTDAIAHGGKSSAVIHVLDGFATISFNLKTATNNPTTFADKLRKLLVSTLQAHRLVELSTPKTGTLPPQINNKHAWAVIGYDAQTDVLRVWNPHGNNFKPKGPDGLDNGYRTQAGQFDIPLKDVLKVYGSITFETAKPQPHDASAH